MSNMKVYFDLSDEVKKLLSDNNLSISDVLQLKGVSCNINYSEIPLSSQQGVRNRDLVLFLTSIGDVLSALLAIWQTFQMMGKFLHVKLEECCSTRNPPCKTIYECKEIEPLEFRTVLEKQVELKCTLIIKVSIRNLKP